MDFESFKNPIDCSKYMPTLVECRKIPDLSKMCEEVVKKKSVSFSENVNVETFTEPRKNNVCPKYNLPYTEEDVMVQLCKNGMYLEDLDDQLKLVKNGLFNDSNKVNNKELKKQTPIIRNLQVRSLRKAYFMNQKDVSYLTTTILLEGNNIIKNISTELLLDCILNMMEIYEHLETEESCCTLSYKESVTISNRPGKRQRGIIKKKVTELTKLYL